MSKRTAFFKAVRLLFFYSTGYGSAIRTRWLGHQDPDDRFGLGAGSFADVLGADVTGLVQKNRSNSKCTPADSAICLWILL